MKRNFTINGLRRWRNAKSDPGLRRWEGEMSQYNVDVGKQHDQDQLDLVDRKVSARTHRLAGAEWRERLDRPIADPAVRMGVERWIHVEIRRERDHVVALADPKVVDLRIAAMQRQLGRFAGLADHHDGAVQAHRLVDARFQELQPPQLLGRDGDEIGAADDAPDLLARELEDGRVVEEVDGGPASSGDGVGLAGPQEGELQDEDVGGRDVVLVEQVLSLLDDTGRFDLALGAD